MRDDSAEILLKSFLQKALVSSSGMGRDSHFWCCLSSISSANHCVVHRPRCLEGWFLRGCRAVWHTRTVQLVYPLGSWMMFTWEKHLAHYQVVHAIDTVFETKLKDSVHIYIYPVHSIYPLRRDWYIVIIVMNSSESLRFFCLSKAHPSIQVHRLGRVGLT